MLTWEYSGLCVCACACVRTTNPQHDWFDLTHFDWYARFAIREGAVVFTARAWKTRTALK